MKQLTPLVSIISVTFNDVWALTKTMRSVFEQNCTDFEYLVVDGHSSDSTSSLVAFWQSQGLVDHFVCEPDSGVYDAMNKAAKAANGKYLCFLNAGDTFFSSESLAIASNYLRGLGNSDGILGWGQLADQLQAAWTLSPAFKLASLGFCHQALFLRRELLLENPFDSRPFKTDSDTLQFSTVLEKGADIRLLPKVLVQRSPDPGISADLERTKTSIKETLQSCYPELSGEQALSVIQFRRKCDNPKEFKPILIQASQELKIHLALMVLDTLFLRQSLNLSENTVSSLLKLSVGILDKDENLNASTLTRHLMQLQKQKAKITQFANNSSKEIKQQVQTLDLQLTRHREKRSKPAIPSIIDKPSFQVSLTTFPGRMDSLYLVLESLFNQTVRPEKINLIIGKDEFRSKTWLPGKVLNYENEGLEIILIPKTCHQYDKFLSNYEENQKSALVIVDDDVIYPPDSLKYLIQTYKKHPDCVIANRAHRMIFSETNELLPYESWEKEVTDNEPKHCLFPTGAGGVLFPKGFIDKEIIANQNLLLRYAPYADDVWFKICELIKNIKVKTTDLVNSEPWYVRYTPTMTTGALHKTNVDLGLNDKQLKASFQYLEESGINWKDLLGDTA